MLGESAFQLRRRFEELDLAPRRFRNRGVELPDDGVVHLFVNARYPQKHEPKFAARRLERPQQLSDGKFLRIVQFGDDL